MKGNQVHPQRAEDKRLIKLGLLNPAQVLRQAPDHWQRATVLELLSSMHRVGRSRACKWLLAERIEPGTEIGTLTELQRFRLAKHVETAVKRAERGVT